MNRPLFYQCRDPLCRLRFPAQSERKPVLTCPRCGSPVYAVPTRQEIASRPFQSEANNLPVIEAVLDNIRSTFNVGAMFRTADGAGLQHMHLCGITPMPEHPRVAKTSLGAEYSVQWTYYENGVEAVQKLKLAGMKILALEIGAGSTSLFETAKIKSEAPIALVIGNEVTGIDPGILELCDQQVWIPMLGFKRSLNAAIAFAVAAYTLRFASSGKIGY